MKTYIFTALIAALVNPSWYFAQVPAFHYTLEEEAYVEDIAFNTEEVVFDLATRMDEEPSVYDIPFNTRAIVMSLGTTLPEEAYVDDIPFDTHEVAMSKKVGLPDEAYVDDIPFDTECVVHNRHMRNELMARCLYKNHKQDSASTYLLNQDSTSSDLAYKYQNLTK